MSYSQEALDWCREQRAQAEVALASIERDGWKHSLQIGNEPPVDVTQAWADRERATIERMDKLIVAWEARDA